ncbi:MAG TPA: cytochrome c1 [Vitreimonas sp.]|uniref:cytochrome c1 n=1 Tax=Vitreimonas sp. TaxID=3069702 RepID=UPI002D6BE21E|nr:cytochrome c1 [Vitreimonas sp.]HYD87891.1 cytochrome c1 [Vitreimonas sp.]
MLRALSVAAAVMIAGVGVAFAAGDAEHPHDHAFSFDSPVDGYDMAAVQRGYQVYQQVCATCHGMDHLAYRHLGEEGGPFAGYMVRNHETGELELVIGKPEHGGQFVDVTENPYVRAIAAGVTISDVDPNSGQMTDRPGRISDRFRRPFPNEIAARAANGGAYPPDLSVITSARHGGADYIYALLTGYTGASEGALYENPYFPGHMIAMPPPLAEGAVPYADGSPTTVEQYAADVTHFLQWAADPHMEERKRMGIVVLAFLIVLTGLLYLSYKQIWRNESH